MSPLGLILVMADAVQDVQRAGVRQSVLLDDRVLVAPEVGQLLHGFRLWKSWSRRLGFLENEDKIVALAQDGFQHHAWMRAGFREDQVRRRSVFWVWTLRLRFAAGKVAQRSSVCLLVFNTPRDFRVPQFRLRSVEIFFALEWFRRSHGAGGCRASLLGMTHCIKCGERSRSRSCFAGPSHVVGRRELQRAFALGLPPVGAWCRRVGDAFVHRRWISSGRLAWNHPVAGSCSLLVDPLDRVLHLLRVSWRHCRWLGFLQRRRRDSVLLADVPFDRG